MLSVTWFFFVAIAIAAAVVDLATYRIPNLFVAVFLIAFVGIAALHWSDVDLLSHIGAGLVIFGAGVTLYAFGQMGAGDVKLFGVVALWAGIYGVIPLLFWTSLCGLTGMIAILIARRVVPLWQTEGLENRGLPRVLVKGEGIPYGIGIGPGAIIASFSFPPWLWH